MRYNTDYVSYNFLNGNWKQVPENKKFDVHEEKISFLLQPANMDKIKQNKIKFNYCENQFTKFKSI